MKVKNKSVALAKWMPSGPTREVICVKRGKDAAMLAGKPAGEHSQRQTEGRALQLHFLSVYLFRMQPACQERLTEMEFFYCLPGSRDKQCWRIYLQE